MKTSHRIGIVVGSVLTATLVLGPSLLRNSAFMPVAQPEEDQALKNALTEIQRSLKKIEQNIETLADRKPRFEKLADETNEIHKLRAEVTRLRTIQQENDRLRDELLQTTEDLFTLSDVNQDLSHQLEEATAPTRARTRYRAQDPSLPLRILDGSRSLSTPGEALENSPTQLALSEDGEFIFVTPSENLELGFPEETGTVLTNLPDSHPTTSAECSVCHAPQELVPEEAVRVRIQPRSASLTDTEVRNILKL